jgi:hypothetical protein
LTQRRTQWVSEEKARVIRQSEGDIVKSYQLHANFYLRKPVQLTAFEQVVKSINDF